MKYKEKHGRKILSFFLSLAMVISMMPQLSLTVRAEEYPSVTLNWDWIGNTSGPIRLLDGSGSGVQLGFNNSKHVVISSKLGYIKKVVLNKGTTDTQYFSAERVNADSGTIAQEGDTISITEINSNKIELSAIDVHTVYSASIVVYYDDTSEWDSGDCHLSFDYTTGTMTVTRADGKSTGDMADYSNESDVPWKTVKSNITRVVIGSGVKKIGMYAFTSCSQLSSATMKGANPPTLNNDPFDSSITAIYVPVGMVATYKAADGWSSYESKILEDTTKTYIGSYDSNYIYVNMPASWGTPYLYMWGNSTGNKYKGNWPGTAMEVVDADRHLYRSEYPALNEGDTSANFIFNNNSSPQTADLTYDRVTALESIFTVAADNAAVTYEARVGTGAVITLVEGTADIASVKYGAETLTEGTNYTVSYKDSNHAVITKPTATGAYKVIVTGTGNYWGSVEKEFEILASYTVTFDSNGGSEVSGQTVVNGNTYGELPTPTRPGYTFNGWYYGDDEITSSTTVNISENITLTAKWTMAGSNVIHIKGISGENKIITVDLNNDTIAITKDKIVDIFNTSQGVKRLIFAGRLLDDDTKTLANCNIQKEFTLHVIFDNEYTVSFNTNGGNPVSSQTLVSGNVATTPDEPEKEGYIFAGWYADADLTSQYDFDNAVTSDLTLYAKWVRNISHTVTFKVVNGSWNDGEGEAATVDKTVTLTGYEGDALKLTADQIPAVGSKPNDTYKAGSWDTIPSTDTAITENVTYTYTYVNKTAITLTVTITGWTYGDTANAPSVTGNIGNGTVTYAYAAKDSTDFSATVPTVAGEYTVKASVAETDNYLAGTATADFTIVKAAASVTTAPTAKNLTYDGTAQELVTAGEATGGTMQYAIGNANGATGTYTTSIPSKTDAGTYYVWYKVVGDANHVDSAGTPIEVTIDAKVIGLSWSNTALTYSGEVQMPVATATGLCGIDTCNVTVTGGQKDANAKTETENYTATASALDNPNYKLPETATTTFTIAPKEVTITWNETTLTYNGSAQKPTAMITAGTVVDEIVVVTVEGAEIDTNAKTGQDNYTATAVIENANYISSEATKAVAFTIQPKVLSDAMLTLTPDSFVQDTTVKTPTVTVTDTEISTNALVLDNDYTVAESFKTSGTDYGTYTVTVNGKGNYTGSASQTWKIEDRTAPTATIIVGTHSFNQFMNTITFGIFFKKTQAVKVTAEDNEGGSGIDKVYYHVSDTALTEAEVKALADGSWKEITNGMSFNIDPNRKCVVYVRAVDKSESRNMVYISSNGMVIDAVDPVITGVDADAEYHSAASWQATDDYLDKVEITFVAEGKTTEDSETDTKTATDGQTLLEGTVSALGSYTVKATDKSENEKIVTFSITRRDADIIGKADSITYEADRTYDLSQLFTVEGGVTVDAYEIVANADTNVAAGAGTITGSTLTVTKAGLITIKATVAAGQTSVATPKYINKTTAEGRLTVSRAAGNAGITINDAVYGKSFTVALNSTNAGVTPEIKYTMTTDAAGNEIPAASQTESTDKPVNVGTYKAVVTYAASGLYNAVSAQTTFKITPATLTVTAETKEKTYGREDPALTYTASGFVYEDTKETVLTGALTRATGESVGTYAIGQGTLAANGNYTISYTGADLTIGKKTLTVTAEAKEKTYGGTDPALTYTVSGLENGDMKETVLTGALTRAAGEDVGTYAIGQGTLVANGNYTVNYTGADLTISKKTLTVTAGAKSKTYGGADPAFTYTATGFENGDTKESVMTGAMTRAAGEDVGTYAIQQGTLAANDNYTISYTGADLTIGKKTMDVTAEAKTKKYGEDDPALTYTATGFENGDTKDTVFTGVLTRKSGEAVGTYVIEQGTLAANNNYTVNYTGADLTITKTDSKVTAPTANMLTYTGKAQALVTAGSTEDGTLAYSLDGETYTETILTATNAGTYTIYYMVTGDSNHNDAEAATVSVTINKAEMADKTVTNAVEVISAGVKDETIDLKEYLQDGTKLEKAEKSGELADYITAGELKDGIFTYSIAENGGGITGSIQLTVSSINYKDYTIRINLVVAKKITEIVVESEEVEETAVETVEVPALEDFTEAQPEATVEVKMEVKLESEETVEKELGTAALTKIKDTITKAFGGVASTELSQEYLDITVTKSVNGGTPQEISDVNRVLEIAVGYDLTGKYNPIVIREHGGAVCQFTKLSSRPAAGSYRDGTFFVEGSGTSGKIYIYARYFSTYTVAYTTAASYQVTFDDATGDEKAGSRSNIEQVIVETGAKAAKPADPKRDGYDFEGWYIEGTNTKWNFDTAVTGDITLVAHWDEEDDDDEEIVPVPAPVVTEAPRSPKTGDVLPDYVLWMMIVAAGLSVGGSAVWGRRKEQE